MHEIIGPDTIIANYFAGYTVTPQDAASYTWAPTGGDIISGQGSGAVIIQWGAAGPGNLEVDLDDARGEIINSVSIPIDIQTGGNTPHS